MSTESNTLRHARRYVEKGLSVIPLSPGTKIPQAGFPVLKYRSTMPTDAELVEWFASGEANVAVLTGELVVLDDDGYARDAEMERKLRQIIPAELGTLTVQTPRGGFHHWFWHHDADVGNHTHLLAGKLGGKTHLDVRGVGGYVVAPPSVIDGKAYTFASKEPIGAIPPGLLSILLGENGYASVTMHCNGLKGNGLKGGGNNCARPRACGEEGESAWFERDNERDMVRDRASKSVTSVTSTTVTERDGSVTARDSGMFLKGNRDVSLFYVAARLKEGGCPRAKATEIVAALARSCAPPFPERQALAKVQSAYVRELPGNERDLRTAVEEWVSATDRTFSYGDLDRDLELRTAKDKTHRRKIIQRLVADGVLEAVGNKVGVFRPISQDSPVIDWKSADVSGEWNIEYPFGIEKYFITLPRNMVLIDGTTDAGKSAFLMNVAYRNAGRFPGRIFYLSSEMGGLELKSRISQYPDPSAFEQVVFEDRCGNFQDAIRPDAINIIDYLEVQDEFWKVGQMMRAIFEKLRTGICLIARQKLSGAKSGRGGDFGKQLPRLVLLMDPGELTIDKCKNWRDPLSNPRGRSWKFKLVRGWRFLDQASNALSEGEF